MQKTVEEVRQRMLHAWDGVESLHVRATKKLYRVAAVDHVNRATFLTPDVLDIDPYHYEAWWEAPHHWRHDREVPSHPFGFPHMAGSYIVVGDNWWLKERGRLVQSGTVTESRRTRQTEGDDLSFGRPYLSARENISLWPYLNPQTWAVSLGFVINDGRYPPADDVFHDRAIIHVVAGYWNSGQSRLPREPGQHLIDPNQSADDLSDTNIFQLWVDMRTGFCRRITGEAANGRAWDIILDELVINPVEGIAPAVFCP